MRSRSRQRHDLTAARAHQEQAAARYPACSSGTRHPEEPAPCSRTRLRQAIALREAWRISSWSGSKEQLDRRIGELAGWRLHDLRRTMSTVMHGELGVPPHVVEAVLNHVGASRWRRWRLQSRRLCERKSCCACALGRLFGGRCRCMRRTPDIFADVMIDHLVLRQTAHGGIRRVRVCNDKIG